MLGTILGQGSFVVPATVVPQVVAIPCGADWIKVWNYTQIGLAGVAASGTVGYEFYWQKGMPQGSAIVSYKTVTTNARVDDQILTGGFTIYDPSGNNASALPLIGNASATTASTNATAPVVTVTATTASLGIVNGSIVRMSGTAQTDINGVDFSVRSVTANGFTLTGNAGSVLANVPGAIGGAGFVRVINTMSQFYPRRRYITNISNATTPTVSTSVPHGMTPGQIIRFSIPQLATGAAGMTQLDGQTATVLSVTDDWNFVVNVDTSAYNTFAWPTIAQQPSSFPLMVPVGEDTANALVNLNAQVPTIGGLQINNTNTGILADSAVNTGYLGMIFGTGASGVVLTTNITGPAGTTAADVVYWVAGKSEFGGF